MLGVAPLLWPSVGVKPNTWKSWDLESSGTPECSELDSKAQNTSHWGLLGVIGKVLKRRYRKCPRIGNSNIVAQVMGKRRAGSQTVDHEKSGIDLFPRSDLSVRHGVAKISTRATTLVQTLLRSDSAVGSYGRSKFWESRRDNFGTPFRESQEFVPFGCNLHCELQRILHGGRWWLPLNPGHGESCVSKCLWLVPTPKGVPNAKLTSYGWFLDADLHKLS
jgi:hypothetical protein